MAEPSIMGISKAKSLVEKFKSAKETGNIENFDDLAQKANFNIEELGKALREEIEETHKAHRKEMQKNMIEMGNQFALERKHMKETAVWQWVITIAVVIAAFVKEVYF